MTQKSHLHVFFCFSYFREKIKLRELQNGKKFNRKKKANELP